MDGRYLAYVDHLCERSTGGTGLQRPMQRLGQEERRLEIQIHDLSQPFSGKLLKSSPQAAPALLTRISSFDSRSASAAAGICTPPTVDRSCGSAWQLGPRASAVVSQSAALRELM